MRPATVLRLLRLPGHELRLGEHRPLWLQCLMVRNLPEEARRFVQHLTGYVVTICRADAIQGYDRLVDALRDKLV